jgi:hypothetical protein
MMSSFSSWNYTAKATFWAPVRDAFDQPTSWVRHVFDCTFKAGGFLMLGAGTEQFLPKTFVYLEASDEDVPKIGWKMKPGLSTASAPPDDAEVVRIVRTFDPSTFNEGLPDREVVTG